MSVIKLQTLLRLKLRNLYRVFKYRVLCRLGYFAFLYPIKPWKYPFQDFKVLNSDNSLSPLIASYVDRLYKSVKTRRFLWYFNDWFTIPVESSIWCYDPYTRQQKNSTKHWSRSNYFFPGFDIKNLWEQSRFYWLPPLALACRDQSQDISVLNNLLRDWCSSSKVNEGFQWVCGQEVSIRLINFILAQEIVGRQCTGWTSDFVLTHLKRVNQTLDYAIAQQNNHATSEACALIIGGCFLSEFGSHKILSRYYIRKGARLLGMAVNKLVLSDGGFSQYSVTYHRLFLDALSLTLLYYLKYQLDIPETLKKRYQKAVSWLAMLALPETHDVINLGANDGALLFNLTGHDYRNFSFSLNLAQSVCNTINNKNIPDDIIQLILNVSDDISVCLKSYDSGDFGLIKMVQPKTQAVGFLRYPNFTQSFRPSQSDLLHFDLWYKGRNLLIDSGSFSYNPAQVTEALKHARCHNTIEFKDKDQMPILSRFLYGCWPVIQDKRVDFEQRTIEVTYVDYNGYRHKRRIEFTSDSWTIIDEVSHQGKLRWHLNDKVTLLGECILTENFRLTVSQEDDILVPQIEDARHSRYYQGLEMHNVCIFDLNTSSSGLIVCKTVIEFMV